jgi:Zn-dependent peptidase ImmA (M78 family)/transcriptional regulator with XRE-family HTH domain
LSRRCFSELAAARKIGVDDDRVELWERGEAIPTIPQLRSAAATYHRSLGVFFLDEPPKTFDTMRDFRRLEGTPDGAWSLDLHVEYRRAQTQRETLLELRDIDDVTSPSTWSLTVAGEDDGALAVQARARLLAVGPLSLPSGSGTVYDHWNAWVAALEMAGVLVLATSGGRVVVSEMRAFSLYYDTVPVIMVNGSDYPRGRLFSLLHEYAHLLLHTEGLCDVVTDRRATSPNRRLEARCNAIAAEILMPAHAVLARPEVVERRDSPTAWNYAALRSAAAPFGVSAEAFLRRLLTLGRTTQVFYEEQHAEYQKRYEADGDDERSSGGNWYRNKARDFGKGFVRDVTSAYSRRVIDSTTAATYLDAKVSQLARLADTAALKPGSAR